MPLCIQESRLLYMIYIIEYSNVQRNEVYIQLRDVRDHILTICIYRKAFSHNSHRLASLKPSRP